METKLYGFFIFLMSLHYIFRITKNTNRIDISLTETHSEENHSPSVVFWKEYAFTLKVMYGKLLYYNLIIFFSVWPC